MGTLSFKDHQFFFSSSSLEESKLAYESGLQTNPTGLWVTRKPEKAIKLRRFADESAEQKFKKYFITQYEAPEQILYSPHLKPKPFQIESALHALTRSPAYIADDAGLGKTITSVLCMNTNPGRVLVVCPPFLKYNWENEINKWSYIDRTTGICNGRHTPNHIFLSDVVIVPDTNLILGYIREQLSKQKFTWCFVDEAHRFKDPKTKRTEGLLDPRTGVIRQCDRVVYLSGTPIPNGRPMELFPILELCAPEAMGHRSYTQYGQDFCDGRQSIVYERGRPAPRWDFSGHSNLNLLNKLLKKKFMIHHTKEQVLKELPPKTRKIIFMDSPTQVQKYEAAVLKSKTLDELMGEDHTLGDIATYRRHVGEYKMLAAFEIIQEHLHTTDEKVVIFAHHREVVAHLRDSLNEYHPLVIVGGMSAKLKQSTVETFQGEPHHRVIIGNMDAMGVGNTLTAAPAVFIVEPSWVPGVNEQAEDRVHRMTQDKNVYIRYLVLRNSLDERMLTQVLNKQKAIDQVMA